LPLAVSACSGSGIALIWPAGGAPAELAGAEVDDQAEHEQDGREVEQRGGVERADRLGVLERDHAGRRVAAQEEVEVVKGLVADHLADGDRLADRAAEAEHARGDHP
jgi:hypothetical protein